MVKEVVIEDRTFKLGAIRVGQMRDMAMVRQNEPSRGPMEDNIDTVLFCLQNGGEQISRQEVENLPWPVYRQLVEIASEVSGFNLKEIKPGEESQVPQLTGLGSTQESPVR
jgi:hypothetical protein